MARRSVNPSYEIAKALAKLEKASYGDIKAQTDLADPTIARHLEKMLDKKLLIAEEHPKDKRKLLYSLNPNELCLITVDEAIKAIKKELEAVGEKLTAEEEKELRSWLIKHFRAILIEELKADFPLDKYLVEQHVKDWLSSIAIFSKIMKALNVSFEERASGVEKVLKQLTPFSVAHISPKAIADFPKSLLGKWSKTKAFKRNPATIVANLFGTGKFKLT